ncbi:MAG: enoyl-CoA hydratase/isomerase family protein [SAR324 cluster bacterium]|nr:enoyl-CoA hydratase/isomerase family protein [SAR324 cluster bacterium]
MKAQLEIIDQGKLRALVLCNPRRRNALSLAMMNSLLEALAEAASEKLSALILTSTGSTFSAGADLTDINGTLDDLKFDETLEFVKQSIETFPFPVIGAIEGACIGAAFDLVTSCDMLLVAEGAYFQIPAARLGLLYNPSSIAKWHTRLGSSLLSSMLLTGNLLDAKQAVHKGLAIESVPTGKSMERAWQLAEKAAEGNPEALSVTKALLRDLDSGSFSATNWESPRRKLLGSPERRKAVIQAKSKLGIKY